MKKRRHAYFVSFAFFNSVKEGFGNIIVFMPKRISSVADHQELDRRFKDNVGVEGAIIIGYQYIGKE